MSEFRITFFLTPGATAQLGLKPLAAGESGFQFVPPLDLVVFAELPAEEDDAAVTHRREVDQAAGVVL